MPSRKKAKGKARKAAREAKKAEAEEAKKAKAEEVEASADQRQEQEGSLEALIKRMGINSPEKCVHGSPTLSRKEQNILQDFVNDFVDVAYSYSEAGAGLGNAFEAAYDATLEEYAEVYCSQIDAVISWMFASVTQLILNKGDNDEARFYAMIACFFEEWRAVHVRKSKSLASWTKICELNRADDHTLVQYYRKRIPCSCLDEKYKEVKSVKKMGLCYNLNCSQPGNLVERSKMLSCARCGEVNYCSIECQKAAWKRHRRFCDRHMKEKVAFDSEQQSRSDAFQD